jgi:hypothetical protein
MFMLVPVQLLLAFVEVDAYESQQDETDDQADGEHDAEHTQLPVYGLKVLDFYFQNHIVMDVLLFSFPFWRHRINPFVQRI